MAQGREGQKGKVTRPSASGGRAPKDTDSIAVADDTSQDITVLTDKAIPANSPLAVALRAAEGAPDDLGAWEQLESAAAADGRPAIALGAYRRILESGVSAATGLALGRRAAAYQSEWLA